MTRGFAYQLTCHVFVLSPVGVEAGKFGGATDRTVIVLSHALYRRRVVCVAWYRARGMTRGLSSPKAWMMNISCCFKERAYKRVLAQLTQGERTIPF